MSKKKKTYNPISKDKITDKPSFLEYAHTVGSIKFEPTKVGQIKKTAEVAMVDQTNMQLKQIYEQMQLLATQATAIQNRVEVSRMIYKAKYSFKPLINHTYHLYEDDQHEHHLSLIGPDDWGRSKQFKKFIASATLLADHTWKIIQEHTDA